MHKTSNSETEVITILCSRSVGFSIFADFTLNIGAKALNLNRNLFQSFSGWSSAFAEKLLEPGQSAERLSFTDLSKCRSLRSGFVLFGLFLFAQHRRLQDRSDMRFAEQAYAARKLDWLIAQFGDEVRPLLAEMEDAPGMRAVEARQLRELLDKMERASKLPSGKACRNAAHRERDCWHVRSAATRQPHRQSRRRARPRPATPSPA